MLSRAFLPIVCLLALRLSAESEETPRPQPTPTPLPTEATLALPEAPRAEEFSLADGRAVRAAAPGISLPESTRDAFFAPPQDLSHRWAPPETRDTPARPLRDDFAAPAPAVPSFGPAPSETTALASLAPGSNTTSVVSTTPITSRLIISPEARPALEIFSDQTTSRTFAKSPSGGGGQQILSPKGRGKFGKDEYDDLTLKAGGIYYFDIINRNRDRTDLIEVDLLKISSTASAPFTISLGTFDNQGNPSLLSRGAFDSAYAYQWLLIDADDVEGFDPSYFRVDSSGFLNNTQGGIFTVDQVGNQIVLDFTPVPEPGTWALLLGGGLVAYLLRRRLR